MTISVDIKGVRRRFRGFRGIRRFRRTLFGIFGIFGIFGVFPPDTYALDLTYQYQEQIFRIPLQAHWKEYEEATFYKDQQIQVSEDSPLPKGIEKKRVAKWNTEKIARTLEDRIGSVLNRDAGSVIITKDPEQHIVFDGVALPGRELHAELAAELTQKALAEAIYTIQLPVREIPPRVTVEDAELRKRGIRDLVSVGESNFARSPINRRHNIKLGLSKFNGHIIERGEEFSFNETLGPVNATAGFLEELTILGERTIPAYGGGLCQVSTTAYRGVWKAGFPISARRNHSYAVRYYAPEGTDATIYPPWTDMKFVNDTRGALLVQTHTEGDEAYFLYYGTKPTKRDVALIGPFTWDKKNPPKDKVLYTDEIPIGEKRVVSRAVPGMKTVWYRALKKPNGDEEYQEFLSEYEARPFTEEIGAQLSFEQ